MKSNRPSYKRHLDIIINGIDTPLGRAFDIALILCILASSSLLIIDTVESVHLVHGSFINFLQIIFLVVFTIEYILRLLVSSSTLRYVFSFYGLIDFLSIVPIYFTFFLPIGRLFPIIRTLRLLRLFSVFKMGRYVSESDALLRAVRASRTKITVFIITVLFLVIIVGAFMYVVEGPVNGFVNIPESMYWAIVTISTVGYGDISPQSLVGKIVASALMIVGYGIIAVPTGIITSEIVIASKDSKDPKKARICHHCGESKHPKPAHYCHQCGSAL
jgi:voltage-gated potassium channel